MKKKVATNREQIIAEVMRWIVQSGFQFESVLDSKYDFVLTFRETENLPQLQVIHQSADTAFLLIVGLVNIPEVDREKLKSVLNQRFDELVWDIKLNLLKSEVDFTVLGSEKDPNAWEVQTRLFINDANTASFHDACSRVKRALISVIWSYKRALGSIL